VLSHPVDPDALTGSDRSAPGIHAEQLTLGVGVCRADPNANRNGDVSRMFA
jgi:hypothetical protein